MTDEQHMAFTRQFGELEFNPAKLIEKQYGVATQTSGRQREIPPEISVISNILENGKPIGGLGDGEAFWHTEFVVCRCAAGREPVALSRMPAALRRRRDLFSQLYSAYETLPADIKTADRRHDCDPCRDAFSSGGKAHKGFETVEDVSKVPGARQPLVRTHPETGKKCLFLGRRINAYIIGLPVAESESLLDFLWEHTKQDRFTWKQEWRVGDLVWWDNRCAMHRRDAFDPVDAPPDAPDPAQGHEAGLRLAQ